MLSDLGTQKGTSPHHYTQARYTSGPEPTFHSLAVPILDQRSTTGQKSVIKTLQNWRPFSSPYSNIHKKSISFQYLT